MSVQCLPPESPKLTAQQMEKQKIEEARALQAKKLLEARLEIVSNMEVIRHNLRNLPGEAFNYVKSLCLDTAVKIVEHIKADLLNRQEAVSFDELRSLDVQTADIERDCELLKGQLQADNFQGKQPCQRIGESIYVPIGYNLETFNENQIDLNDFEMRSNEDAVTSFGSELVPFLTQRVAADVYAPMRGITGEDNPLMLPITVSTQTLGARVSYSPSYFINYLTLASPTSPVKGMLLPGRYIFMISTRDSKLFDKGVFDIPPTFDIDLFI